MLRKNKIDYRIISTDMASPTIFEMGCLARVELPKYLTVFLLRYSSEVFNMPQQGLTLDQQDFTSLVYLRHLTIAILMTLPYFKIAKFVRNKNWLSTMLGFLPNVLTPMTA